MKKQGFLIYLVLVGVLILSLFVMPGLLRAADREAEINTRIRELTYESAYIRERAKTIQYEARDLETELKALVATREAKEAKEAKEKEDKKNEKKK